MKLYQNSHNDFTLVTHDSRLYSLAIQGQQNGKYLVVSQFIGRVSKDAIVNGTLLRKIPDYLKNKCFTLNSKNYEKIQN